MTVCIYTCIYIRIINIFPDWTSQMWCRSMSENMNASTVPKVVRKPFKKVCSLSHTGILAMFQGPLLKLKAVGLPGYRSYGLPVWAQISESL